MKKILFFALALSAILFSCNRENENEPSKKERNMVKEEMTWKLDSMLVIYNYQTPEEESFVVIAGEQIAPWTYTFYPYKYQFPADLYAVNVMVGDTVFFADKYPEKYCKYSHHDVDGSFMSAGYLCYYNGELFMLRGTKADGTLDTRIVDASTNWDTPVWTITYNPQEDDDVVYERRVEYYSRVK